MSLHEKFETAKALFGDSKFAESQALLQEIQSAAGDDAQLTKQANMWLRKCAIHVPAPSSEAPSAAVASPPTPPVRFEWFQSISHVNFTFYIKNRQSSDVSAVVSGDRSLEVTIKLDETGREYQYSVESLFAPVVAPPIISVRSMKVEVSLAKVTGYNWPALEIKQDDVPKVALASNPNPATVAAATAPPTAAQLSYPNSKGKDWSKVHLEEKEEEGDKPSGDHALNALFKQIYGNATDDQRRAMMKSYQESNGTVLSTNWAEVGSKTVKGEPPKGMEMKPINE
jgi:suppressor of G2 allele of SKP1